MLPVGASGASVLVSELPDTPSLAYLRRIRFAGRATGGKSLLLQNHGVAVYIIRNLLRYIIRTKARVYLAFCEYIIKPQADTRWRVMIYSPKGAEDMHRTSRGDDMPSLRLG